MRPGASPGALLKIAAFARFVAPLIAIVPAALAPSACGSEDGHATASNAGKADGGADAHGGDDGGAESGADTGAGPQCTPKTCAQMGASCGSAPDGCGGKTQCGDCPGGQKCGGGGKNVCGTDECFPKSCAQLGAQCGWVSDGCSQAINCGGCPPPGTCGGGGEPNVCGCTPKSCQQLGATCGTLPDGCEGTVSCGACSSGQTCGGGGPNICGTSGCFPKSCAQMAASCGIASDGCSDVVVCGECPAPAQCGGGGVANQCGCTPKTCAHLGASCGMISTGCGDQISCGSCTAPDTCGGAGIENQCGCTCTVPHATTNCLNGVCAIKDCDPGWGDCDGKPDSGCEADFSSSLSNCGSCGKGCSYANGAASCNDGVCQLGECNAGFGDCDGNATNGCETNIVSDQNHCGACGRVCSGACAGGMCEYTSAETSRKWDQSYLGSGSFYTYNPQNNYQGTYVAEYGVLKSAIGAPDQMFSDLAGATVLDIWVYLYADHWYYFAGGTARIGVHGNSTKPATFPGINQDLAVDFARDEGKWVRLPTDWYASFKSGAYRGITLHAGNSTAGQYYGYVTANATKFKWKYKK